MKIFIKRIFIFALLTAALCGLVNSLYLYREKSQDYGTVSALRNDKATIKNVPEKIEICNFGNSHSFYAFNYESVTDRICFSFALPDQSLRDDLQILKAYKGNIAEDAYIFLSISFTSLFGPPENPDEPMYNRYYKFLPDEYIIGYNRKTDFYVNIFPALSENNIVSLIEKLLGINDHADMWNLSTDEEYSAYHGPMRCRSHVTPSLDKDGNRLIRENELDCLYEIIAVCKEINAVPVLLTVPFLSEYTAPIFEKDPDFYTDFHSLIEKVCSETGAEYYDFSNDRNYSGRYDLFMNTDHLNRTGANIFTNTVINLFVK